MDKEVYCTVDVGGTKILIMLVNRQRKIIFRERYNTPSGATPDKIAEGINKSVSTALAQQGIAKSSMAGLGICIAALVNYDKGLIYQAPNLGWYGTVAFREMIQEQGWDCPIILENDANAAVLGEVTYGAARGHKNAIFITISTGIGGGLFLDGKIFRGSSGFAGEIGHLKPFGKGRRCSCGGMDCLEAWASGTAVACNARLLWEGEDVEADITTAWVFDQARAGNPRARNLVDQALFHISTGLSNLITMLNPSCLVIGGGVVRERADILAQLRSKIRKKAIAPSVAISSVDIVPAELEPESGAWGIFSLMLVNEELTD